MLLFRSLAVGLLGACVYLVADVDRGPVVIERPVTRYIPGPTASAVSVVDVAHGVPTQTLLGLIKLQPDERIATVGETVVSNDLVAAWMIADTVESGARYVDLEVDTRGLPGSRRVLVLLH